jgi:hypothetical protein
MCKYLKVVLFAIAIWIWGVAVGYGLGLKEAHRQVQEQLARS